MNPEQTSLATGATDTCFKWLDPLIKELPPWLQCLGGKTQRLSSEAGEKAENSAISVATTNSAQGRFQAGEVGCRPSSVLRLGFNVRPGCTGRNRIDGKCPLARAALQVEGVKIIRRTLGHGP